ncbi:MAG: uncharacterized protein QOG54_1395 [Actinomycetota bacterium]|nr:uncharacterized protein [Actinomycetota bacterium]
MPQIKQTFTVQEPVTKVWQLFQDVPAVAACMPGVELLSDLGGGAYEGKMGVRLGPIKASFLGEATLTETDDLTYVGAISAKGVDKQGGSRASAKVRYALTGEGASTNVDIQADLSLQGPMAQFGRTGLIQEVTAQLTKEFAQCLEAKLRAETAEQAAQVQSSEVKGFRIFFKSLGAWLKGIFNGRRDRGE